MIHVTGTAGVGRLRGAGLAADAARWAAWRAELARAAAGLVAIQERARGAGRALAVLRGGRR